MKHHFDITVDKSKLSDFLNDLESHVSGLYEIITIIPGIENRVMVVVALTVTDNDPEFDEDKIKRKLGMR